MSVSNNICCSPTVLILPSSNKQTPPKAKPLGPHDHQTIPNSTATPKPPSAPISKTTQDQTASQKQLPEPPQDTQPLPPIPISTPPHQLPPTLPVVHNSSPTTTSDSESDAHDVDSEPPHDPHPSDDAHDDDNDDETWVEWIKRCTHTAEALLKSLGVEDWISEQRRRKWRFAAKVVTDSFSKWNIKALMWEPEHDTRYNAKRRQGRPVMRWTDDLAQHVNEPHTPQHNQDDSNDDDNNDDNDDDYTHANDNPTTTSNATQPHLIDWMVIATSQQRWRQLENIYVKGVP